VPSVTFIQPDGSSQTVEAPIGESVMKAAMKADVPGIVAECGGNCSCATCHAHVDEQWFGRLESAGDFEAAMLDGVIEQAPTSRLTCQIKMREDLDGMVVRVPASQY